MANYQQPAVPLTMAPIAAPGVIGLPQNNTNTNPTPAAMQTNGASHSFAQDHWVRYRLLKGVDDAKNSLIEDVLGRYDALMLQCENLINEQNAQTALFNASKHDSELVGQQAEYIDHLQKLMNGNPFVVVLVDGTELSFNDAFIRDGVEGGRRAAVVLKDELSEWVSKSVEEPPSNFKVLVKVYANFQGLAGTLMRGGVTENMSAFGEFARGFNTLFDFVNIGGGDVNNRLVDHLKLFLDDYHCHQVIFGGASQLLEKNAGQKDRLKRRVTLLQSVPSNENLPFKAVSFTEVFRTSKIVTNIPVMTPRTGTPASSVENGSGQVPVTRSRNDSLASSVSVANAPAPRTWAKLAQESAPLPQTSTVPRNADSPARRYNAKGQRIDPPFNNDWEALKRIKNIKMCNMNYLHPDGCKWSDERCSHTHTYPATDAEKEILKSVSRETACNNGVTCKELVCVYGHRCPYPPAKEGSMRGLGCIMGANCRFPREMHGIKDSTPARATNTGKF